MFNELRFSEEQLQIATLIENQITAVQTSNATHDVKRVFVQGKAGSGKSTLIHYITNRLNDSLGSSSYLLLAPTGVAAININGSTIHSKLLITPSSSNKPLTSKQLHKLQEDMIKCEFLIIDETVW